MRCGIKGSNANANKRINTGYSHGAMTISLCMRIETLREHEECGVSLGRLECFSAHFGRWQKCLNNCSDKTWFDYMNASQIKRLRCEWGCGFSGNASGALASQ